MFIGYARVSTTDQNLSLQKEAFSYRFKALYTGHFTHFHIFVKPNW